MLNYNIKYKIVDLGISSIWNFPAFDLSAILENVSDQIQPRENGGWRKIHNFLLRVPCIEGEAGRHKVYSAQVCSEYKVEIGPRITTGQNDNNYISNF